MDIATGFLDADPNTWDFRDDCKIASSVANGFKVVNDLVESGIALVEECNSLFTKDKEQKQFLLQIVQDHRSRIPDVRKSALRLTRIAILYLLLFYFLLSCGTELLHALNVTRDREDENFRIWLLSQMCVLL